MKSLDRARRGYVKLRDPEGLGVVLDMAALIAPSGDEPTRIECNNLTYAVKQNLRHESRRATRERREPWVDPYPDLQAPSEHTGLVSRAASRRRSEWASRQAPRCSSPSWSRRG